MSVIWSSKCLIESTPVKIAAGLINFNHVSTSSPTFQFALGRIATATFSCFDYEVLQVFDPLFG